MNLDDLGAPPRKRQRISSPQMALDDDEAALGQGLQCQVMNEGSLDVRDSDEGSRDNGTDEDDERGASTSHDAMNESLDCEGEGNGYVFESNGVCFQLFKFHLTNTIKFLDVFTR